MIVCDRSTSGSLTNLILAVVVRIKEASGSAAIAVNVVSIIALLSIVWLKYSIPTISNGFRLASRSPEEVDRACPPWLYFALGRTTVAISHIEIITFLRF